MKKAGTKARQEGLRFRSSFLRWIWFGAIQLHTFSVIARHRNRSTDEGEPEPFANHSSDLQGFWLLVTISGSYLVGEDYLINRIQRIWKSGRTSSEINSLSSCRVGIVGVFNEDTIDISND